MSAVRARLARGAHRLFGPAALRRLVGWRPLAGLLCVVLICGLAYRAEHRQRPVDDSVSNVPRVGPVDGEQVAAYLRRSNAELTVLAAGRPVWALVGFTAYQAPAAVTTLLTGYRVDEVLARVPLPDVQTQLVTLPVNTLSADVAAGMLRIAAAKEQDAAQAAGNASAAGTAAQLRAAENADAALDRREASAYRALCACAYAAVVRADGAALRVLAARAGVRVVDPAAEVTRLDRATFVPLLPEQSKTVGPPGDTTTASPTPSAG